MAKAAILALKDRTGSSLPAIKKYIATELKVTVAPHNLNKAIATGVKNGKFVKVKGSYKLAAAAKKAPKKAKAK